MSADTGTVAAGKEAPPGGKSAGGTKASASGPAGKAPGTKATKPASASAPAATKGASATAAKAAAADSGTATSGTTASPSASPIGASASKPRTTKPAGKQAPKRTPAKPAPAEQATTKPAEQARTKASPAKKGTAGSSDSKKPVAGKETAEPLPKTEAIPLPPVTQSMALGPQTEAIPLPPVTQALPLGDATNWDLEQTLDKSAGPRGGRPWLKHGHPRPTLADLDDDELLPSSAEEPNEATHDARRWGQLLGMGLLLLLAVVLTGVGVLYGQGMFSGASSSQSCGTGTQTADYEACLSKWPKDLTDHFPAEIPSQASATNTEFSAVTPGKNGAGHIQLSIVVSASDFSTLVHDLRKDATVIYSESDGTGGGGSITSHMAQENGMPTTNYYTTREPGAEKSLTFPSDFDIILYDKVKTHPAVDGPVSLDGTHGSSHGVAVSNLRKTIVYFAEQW